MWNLVEYKQELENGDTVRVNSTGHEAVICEVIRKDRFGQKAHAITYRINPKDPNCLGGHWYFSHDFSKRLIVK